MIRSGFGFRFRASAQRERLPAGAHSTPGAGRVQRVVGLHVSFPADRWNDPTNSELNPLLGCDSSHVRVEFRIDLPDCQAAHHSRSCALSPWRELSCWNTFSHWPTVHEHVSKRVPSGGFPEREANPSRDAGRWTGSLIRTAGLNRIGDDRHRFIIERRSLRDAHETDENECNHAAPIS